MSDDQNDTTQSPRVHTISLETQGIERPVAPEHRCQATMRGDKGWRKRGYTSIKVGKWSAQCPNRATVTINGKRYCETHAP